MRSRLAPVSTGDEHDCFVRHGVSDKVWKLGLIREQLEESPDGIVNKKKSLKSDIDKMFWDERVEKRKIAVLASGRRIGPTRNPN